MEAKIVERESFTVAGVQERFVGEDRDFETVWMKEFMPHHDSISSKSKDKAYYGVWFATDQENAMDYFAGMAVETVEGLPEGLITREVPSARYAVFECKVEDIEESWDAIFEEWLPSSEYARDRTAAGFEYYPPDTKDRESPVFLYLPVMEKGRRD